MQTLTQNSKSTLIKSTDELKSLMQYVLTCAKKNGASEACVSVNYDRGFSVDVRMGEVEAVEFNEDKGMHVTVYIGQRKGSASTTDTTPQAIEDIVAAACDIAKVSAEDKCYGLADPKLINNDYPQLDLYHPWSLTPPQAIEMALHCEKHALALDKRIVNADGTSLSTYCFSHGFANTHGCLGVVNSSRHSASCSLIAKEGDVMQRDYDYTTARHPGDLLAMEALAESAGNRALKRLGARQVKTKKVPVMFSSRLSSSLLSTFVSAITGGNLYRKNSFLLDSLGKQIFPETIRIYEQPHILKGLGSTPFDGDGVPTRNNVFVEQGYLKQYALGSYSARRLGMQTTANSGGVFNLTVDATAGEFEDMLKQMHTGLLVTEMMGQGVNILTGDYSRGASGFWVEGGKIQHAVEEVTIAGNLKQMFKDMIAVGSDINPNSATRCGSVLIESMMVAGN